MFKHKLTGALLAAAIAVAGAGALAESLPVSAAQGQLHLDAQTASLSLPESYEQYLELDSPSDIAFSERYVAIAEQDMLYLFDRTEENAQYHIYRHGTAHNDAKISKIQFSDEERLYFSDSLLGFYELDLTNPDAMAPTTQDALTSLSTFYIAGDTIFEASVVTDGTTYLTAPISAPKQVKPFFHDTYKNTPQLGFAGGYFYSVVERLVNIFFYDSVTEQYTTADKAFILQANLAGLKSATVVGGDLFYTVSGSESVAGGLYRCDLATETSELLFAGEGYGALSSFGGMLYAVRGNSVLQYSLETLEKTNYEISSASDSVNRLSGAIDGVRAGNLLVTADSGNRRISVYDMASGEYSLITAPSPYAPSLVATDGEIIAAANGSTVYVYAWNSRLHGYECVMTYNADHVVSGIACLYGKCYFVTHGYCYGVIAEQDEAFALESFVIRDTLGQDAPAALTNDLYGNLYVVRSNGSVFKFTEENFTDATAQGEVLSYTLPIDFSSVRADFEGDLFCLGGNVLYQNGKAIATIDGKEFVYSKDGASLSPVSYALGFEDDSVYFNFGNFVVKTKEGTLGFPTLKTIDAAGVHEEISRVHAPDGEGGVKFADVKKGAVGIAVDLASLGEETKYFPFTSYARTAEEGRGVILAETEKYKLIALYHDRTYGVQLFRAEQCKDAEVTLTEAAGKRYLSSPCTLYNYPCIADAHAVTLPRGTRVSLLFILSPDSDRENLPDLGYDFAYVEAETAARDILRGYVPLSFLTDIDPEHSASENFEIVALKEDTEFESSRGEKTTLSAGTEVQIFANDDGTYLGRYTDEDGKTYSKTLTEEMIDRGGSDAVRIALIVILSVLALVIIGAYFALLPHEKKKRKIS